MLSRTLEAMHHNVVLRDIGLVRFDENHVLLIQFEDILVARQNHPRSTPDSTPEKRSERLGRNLNIDMLGLLDGDRLDGTI